MLKALLQELECICKIMLAYFCCGLLGGVLGAIFVIIVYSFSASFYDGFAQGLSVVFLFPMGFMTMAFFTALDASLTQFRSGFLSVIAIQALSFVCGLFGGALSFGLLAFLQLVTQLIFGEPIGAYHSVIGLLTLFVCPFLYCLIGACAYQLARDHNRI